MKKRIIALILCFVMLAAVVPMTAMAQTAQSIEIADFGTKTYGDGAFSVEVTADTNSKLTDFTYESSNPEVAEIGADGTVTIKAAGETVITVKQAGNSTYAPAEASKNLTVGKKDIMLSSLDLDNREAEFIGVLDGDKDKVELDFDKLGIELAEDMTSADVEDVLIQQGCVKIRGVVTQNAYTDIWSPKEIDTTEAEYVEIAVVDAYDTTNKAFPQNSAGNLTDAPSEYLVGATNAADFIGMSVIAYVREVNYDWEIVSIEADPASNDTLTIELNQFNCINSSGKFEYYATETAAAATSATLSNDVSVIYNNEGGFWIDDVFGDIIYEGGATLESGQITLIDNNDTKGYDVIFVEVAETAVVDYAEEDYVTFKEVTSINGISELEYDSSETYRMVKLIKDGEEIAISDLKEWDVLSIYAASDDADYIVAEVCDNPVVGIITSESNSLTSATGKSYKINDITYDVAAGAYGVDGIAIGDGGTFYIDKSGKIAAFKEDYELAAGIQVNYAYVTAVAYDEDILTGEDTVLFQMVTEEGVVVLNLKSNGAKINGSTVDSSDYGVISSVAEKAVKYSQNSNGEIINISTLDALDDVTGSSYGEAINAVYDADYNRFIGEFYMDEGSHVFLIDPYDAEESVLVTEAALTDGDTYSILAKYADKNAEDYNIVIISADVELPEEPEVETDMGYAYVTTVAFDEDILTGKNTAMIQLVTADGVKVLNLRAKSAKIDGMTVNADDNATTIESIREKVIKYSVNESGEISTILTADCDESITGGMFAENHIYDEANLRFGDDGGFEIAADAQIMLVDPYDAEDSFIGTVSNLVDGESYDIIGKYYKGETEIYSIIVISADIEVPEVPDVETDAEYAYVTAVAFDEDILTGRATALIQAVTSEGVEVLNLKSPSVKVNGTTVKVDDAQNIIDQLAGQTVSFSKNQDGKVSSITALASNDTVTGKMYDEAVTAEYDAASSEFVGEFYIDTDSYVFFIDEDDAVYSYMGTPSDLIDGVDYKVLGYFADSNAENNNIIIVKAIYGAISKKAGLSVITSIGASENADGEWILSLEALSEGETILAETTADVYYDVEGYLTVGDIVKLNIDKNGTVDALGIVFDFDEEVRNVHAYTLEDYAMNFDSLYGALGNERICGGTVTNYRRTSTVATIGGEDFKLSQADNIYVIDTNGRLISITNGSTASFKYYEALYDESITGVDITVDGEVIAENASREDAQMAADYVFVRTYDDKIKDVVIVKGPDDTKIKESSVAYSLSLMTAEDENESVSLFAASDEAIVSVTDFVLTGEKAGNYNLTADEVYSVISAENLVTLTVSGENTTVTGAETGNYVTGATVKLTAAPNPGYRFKGWYVSGRCVSTSESYELTLTGDVEISAVSEYIEGVSDCGTDANGIVWCLYERGVLELEGEGAMENYSGTALIPWYSDRSVVTEIAVGEGITHIGDRSFYNCVAVKKVAIPESVTSIGTDAFKNCDEMTIYGVPGSYAETYAKENNIPFAEYVKLEKLNEITVDMTENTSKWYFDVSLAGIQDVVNVYIAIYDTEGRVLQIVSDVLATEDVTTLTVAKRSDAAYAKVHILDEELNFAAISKKIEF